MSSKVYKETPEKSVFWQRLPYSELENLLASQDLDPENNFPGSDQEGPEDEETAPVGGSDAAQSLRLEEEQRLWESRKKLWEEEALRKVDEGYKAGFQKGLAEAKALWEKEAASLRENFANTLRELEEVRKKVYGSAERELLAIIREAVKKIVSVEIKNSDGFILQTVQEAMQNASSNKEITIRLHPEDFRYLKEHNAELTQRTSGKSFTLTEDASLTRGGCVVVTPAGDVDARVETKLEEVLKVLEEP